MIRIIGCGRVREPWMIDGIAEYTKRIRGYEKFEIVTVADEKAPQNNSEAENQKVIETEGQRLLKQIKPDEYMILLDLAGKEFGSVDLADKIDSLYASGKSRICFVIGGSLGVSKELIQRADLRWKLSECTFPHALCRLIVCEQIYRACKIRAHEPYHK